MKPILLLLLAGSAGLLCSCGSSRGSGQPTSLTHAQRYDPATRAWVPANSVTVRSASLPPHALAPEKSSESAKVLNAATSAPASSEAAGAAQDPGKPGFMKRATRAATSPLRLIGIGKENT